jgi:hypothetical protein
MEILFERFPYFGAQQMPDSLIVKHFLSISGVFYLILCGEIKKNISKLNQNYGTDYISDLVIS